jgi:hypothetical protein
MQIKEVMVRSLTIPVRNISFLFIAAFVSWFLPVVFLSVTPLGSVAPAFTSTPWSEFIKLLEPHRALWVIWQVLDLLSFAFAAVGIYGLFVALKDSSTRKLAIASVVAAAGSCFFWLLRRYIDLALTSDVTQLPPLVSSNEQLRGTFQFAAIALLSLATAFVGFELFASRLWKWPGLVIGVLAGGLFIADIVIGVSGSFAYASGVPSLAPFALLMILGIGMALRRKAA